jgi:hypothetical protein
VRPLLLVTLAAHLSILVPGVAAAQGQGHGHAYGHAHQGGVSAGSGSSTPLPASGTGIRDFGAWLDDASVIGVGGSWVSLSFNYFRLTSLREFDAPVADLGVGVAPRVQFGFSVPYYNVLDNGGASAHGLGDLYMHSKFQLRDAATASNGLGWAVLPIVEVLSASASGDRNRLNWALPVSIELQRRAWRVYGSSGYFSRGSFFASGAVEHTVSDRVWVSGTLSQSHSLHQAAAGLPRVRTDIGGGAGCLLKPGFSVFGSVGRTLSSNDPERTRLSVSAGISMSVGSRSASLTR